MTYPTFINEEAMLEDAITLALHWHHGQVDKAGKPYIFHLLRVMGRMETIEEMVVAVLHDIIEDTPVTAEYLLERGYPSNLVRALVALTKVKGESRMDSLLRAAQNPLALRVKLKDNGDNRDPNRMSNPPTQVELSRKAMYDREHEILLQYVQSHAF
jgi:GTP diphosphokinase / guanosine-3',5'-bis(diphosphate) 3'-diphosphatase